jgi:putative membrane protein
VIAAQIVEALPALAAGLLAWWLYRHRAGVLADQGREVPRWRRWCFAVGVVLAVAAVSPQVDQLSSELLIAHMAQHLMLADLAALLLVLGVTGPVLGPLLSLPLLRHARVLAHPLVALPLWVADLYLWHLPVLYQAALRYPLVHALEHAMFLFAGLNMWLALLGPLPKPRWFGNLARLGYVVGVRLAGAVLANALLWSETVFYPWYRPGAARWGLSALQDQSVAGALMMVEGSFLTIGLFAWLFLRSAREDQERQQLLEAAAARGVALSERRAARAVAAGRGSELRERLERTER